MRVGVMLSLGLVAVGAAGCNKSEVLEFQDSNNYAFTNDITMRSVEIQAGADASIDWTALTTDVRERAVDPGTVEQISLLKFSYPFDELVPLFEVNEIDAQAEATESYLFENPSGTTTANATDFEITAIGFDPTLFSEDPNSTWTVSAINYPGGRLDLLMSKAILPKDASTNHEITLGDDDTTLDWTVDMHSMPALEASPDTVYGLDWSAVTKDVYGHPFDSIAGDELLIGHYADPVDGVEAEFLQLDTVASEIYRMSSLGLTSVDDLSAAIDDGGKAFGGFTADGTWLVAISCTSCSTPVPLLLSVVSVK